MTKKHQSLFLLLFFAVISFTVFQHVPAAQAREFKRPKAPDFTLVSIHGDTVRLSDFRGQVVILDFWATWCPPCKAEIPSFIEIYKTYRDQGVSIIGVALDKPEKVRQFYEDFHMNYPVVIGDRSLAARYGGIAGIPTTFVIDQEGRIYRKYVGYRPKQVFVNDIEHLLAEPQEKSSATQ